MNPFRIILLSTLLAMAAAHSQMTEPQSTAPMTCRLGGEPQFGVETCAGPCDLRAIKGHYAIHASSSNPAAEYKRGQTVTIKYQRNNHAPGGMIRITLVKPDKMMDKREHEKNAFYYSCWGGNAVKAPSHELSKERFGFSMIGSDAEQHNLPPGYYTTKVTIPRVIPDGDYVMGWVWFGGTGGGTIENNRATKEPAPWGYFSDYWSCSFVKIKGGAPLAASHVPVFNNDLSQFSKEGCMSANDFPGVCSYEPCKVTGRYQKPRPFKNGRKPRALTPKDFGGDIPSGGGSPSGTSRPPTKPASSGPRTSGNAKERRVRRRSCRCLAEGNKCWKKLAQRTRYYCKPRRKASSQPRKCKEACCVYCKSTRHSRFCRARSVRAMCML